MKKLLIILLVLLTPALAQAGPKSKRLCFNSKVLFDKVALDGAAGTRTKILDNLEGFDKLRLSAQYTWIDNGTLTFAITALAAQSTTPATEALTGYQSPTIAACSGATCTLTIGLSVVTPTLTAATDFDFYLDLHGETALTIVATESTAASGEFLTLTVQKCVAGGQ